MMRQQGFSTPELLITLFIGAAFIATGYQLYIIVIRDGAAARTLAAANNLGYDTLRQKAADPTIVMAACTPQTITETPSNTNVPNFRNIVTTVTCPVSNTAISDVTVTVNYGTNEVTHGIYAAQN